MVKIFTKYTILSAIFVSFLASSGFAFNKNTNLASDETQMAIEKTQLLIQEIVEESFPELKDESIKVKSFRSEKTFFKAQFSIARYLTFRKLQTTIFINQLVYQRGAPNNGLRAILAHELSHILYFKEKNCIQLLGLVGLANGGFNAKFERRTDLVAIERGYGEGLIEYREWLYQNVSKKSADGKKRNYFTPEEITILIPAMKDDPGIIGSLMKKVPRNLDEVKMALSR